jgi:phosphohistidine phosphatase SixA
MEEERKAQQTARDFETLLQNPESRECWKLLDTTKPAKVKELRDYHVTEGESIAQVAHNVGLSEKNLRGINKLEPGAEVPPGTVLKYPLV